MNLDALNGLDRESAARELLRCCGSSRWAAMMTASRPFESEAAMAVIADVVWAALGRDDWLEAFRAHPRIGAGRAGSAGGAGEAGAADRTEGQWSRDEQSGVDDAARARFARLNGEYEARFGYIFIVCASGKTGAEMLRTLERRIENNPDDELRIAAEEQRLITRLRLVKLLA